MTHRVLALVGAIVLISVSVAPAASQGAMARAKPVKVLMVLSGTQIDPLRLLPPPPEDRSPAQAEELGRLRRIQSARTTERLRRALEDDSHEDVGAFVRVLGPRFDIAHLPATRAVLEVVQNDASVAASMAKTAFHRHRPWMFDAGLTGCSRGKKVDPLTSYPSGHATFGYSEAVVLADLIPSRAQAIMTRASDFGYSRLVCEVHFPSDVAAGATLGTTVGALLIDAPAMRAKISAAKAELKAAGVD